MRENTRLTPRRGRPREDVKQIKIPDNVHQMLFEYAQAHNLTFGDAAAQLINSSILDVFAMKADLPESDKQLDRERRQVKVSKETHAVLCMFASEHKMTIGDAAALLIGVSLMKRYHLDEDAATRETRIKREKRLRSIAPTLERFPSESQRERQKKIQELKERLQRDLQLDDGRSGT